MGSHLSARRGRARSSLRPSETGHPLLTVAGHGGSPRAAYASGLDRISLYAAAAGIAGAIAVFALVRPPAARPRIRRRPGAGARGPLTALLSFRSADGEAVTAQ